MGNSLLLANDKIYKRRIESKSRSADRVRHAAYKYSQRKRHGCYAAAQLSERERYGSSIYWLWIQHHRRTSTCRCGTWVQDRHSVPHDAGLTVVEMVYRGVCDGERRGDQQGLVLGGIASVESMIGVRMGYPGAPLRVETKNNHELRMLLPSHVSAMRIR